MVAGRANTRKSIVDYAEDFFRVARQTGDGRAEEIDLPNPESNNDDDDDGYDPDVGDNVDSCDSVTEHPEGSDSAKQTSNDRSEDSNIGRAEEPSIREPENGAQPHQNPKKQEHEGSDKDEQKKHTGKNDEKDEWVLNDHAAANLIRQIDDFKNAYADSIVPLAPVLHNQSLSEDRRVQSLVHDAVTIINGNWETSEPFDRWNQAMAKLQKMSSDNPDESLIINACLPMFKFIGTFANFPLTSFASNAMSTCYRPPGQADDDSSVRVSCSFYVMDMVQHIFGHSEQRTFLSDLNHRLPSQASGTDNVEAVVDQLYDSPVSLGEYKLSGLTLVCGIFEKYLLGAYEADQHHQALANLRQSMMACTGSDGPQSLPSLFLSLQDGVVLYTTLGVRTNQSFSTPIDAIDALRSDLKIFIDALDNMTIEECQKSFNLIKQTSFASYLPNKNAPPIEHLAAFKFNYTQCKLICRGVRSCEKVIKDKMMARVKNLASMSKGICVQVGWNLSTPLTTLCPFKVRNDHL
ncbi:hypothetical protein TRICI_002713 [Trichomonascus ciferrii]|uniref:Uncharacterized protein n=1 Tax=Trichomonascus ciferrii TaxID=44093 RepID=A0A642V747_9ASCO|nr:hypothetical protein TRICI_002713 [Trichomonascus ciferrii]